MDDDEEAEICTDMPFQSFKSPSIQDSFFKKDVKVQSSRLKLIPGKKSA
jgi:hypothetical protein